MKKNLRLVSLSLIFSLIFSYAKSEIIINKNGKLFDIEVSDEKIEDVLEDLKEQTNFGFLYEAGLFKSEKKVNYKGKAKSVNFIVAQIIDTRKFKYQIVGNNISITRIVTIKKDTKIKGRILDNLGEPLPGVSIVFPGTTTGTVSDIDGMYSITVPEGATKIKVSSMGFAEQIIALTDKVVIDVVMNEASVGIDEVVVTALGIKKQAKALGYSVAKVGEERIMASGTPANALQSLYGSAAGVQVAATAAGSTGGMKINIRNAVSFDENSSTRPLIVVDGIPIHDENTGMSENGLNRDNGTGINDINPDDIASFEILKGAKASVLYGSEGANGVVLITTKSGKKSQGIGVSASITHTWDEVAFLPEFQNQYGTGSSPSSKSTDDQGFYLNENNERALSRASGSFGPKYDPSVQLIWWDGKKRPWQSSGKNVYDYMFRTGHQTTTNVALSSGGKDGSMRFSYTNNDMTPTLLSGEFQKHTFSMSASYKFNEYIDVKYTGNYYMSENKNAAYAGSFDAQGAGSSLGAYSSDIDPDLLRDHLVTEDGFNFFSSKKNKNLISNGRSSLAHYFWDQEQNQSIFERNHSIQSLTVNIKINETFGATVLGGIDLTNTRNQYKGKLLDPELDPKLNGFSYLDENRIIQKNYAQGMVNFNTDVEKFNISGFVGGAMKHNKDERKGGYEFINLVMPNWFSFNNMTSNALPNYRFSNGEDKLYSVLGSLQFAWDNQVFIEAQARNDWSSILPKDNNSYFYPGVSATWIMNETIKMPKFVNFSKVRVSWADVGRPGPRYFSNVNYGVSQSGESYILTPPADMPPTDADGKPNLKPERKREYEIGFEGYFFKDQRIGVDFSLYTNSIYDQIMKVKAPADMIGVDNIRINAGEVSNTGWELLIKTKPVLTKDFAWNLNLTFASSKTKIEELGADLKSMNLWGRNGLNAIAEVGGEYGIITQAKGTMKFINPSDPNDPRNGKQIINDSGSALEYDSKSNRKVGKMLPDLTGGIFTSFEYKGFRLIANIDYSFGATFISETETYMMAAGVLDETLKYRDKAHGGIAYHLNSEDVKVAGEGATTFWDGVQLDGIRKDGSINQKVVSASDYYSGSYFSNGFFPEDRLYKSDYVALRNIALDYTLPKNIANMLMMNQITLSVFANNVAYLYKDAPNSVPESSNGTGWGASNYGTTALPSQRSFGCSAKIKF